MFDEAEDPRDWDASYHWGYRVGQAIAFLTIAGTIVLAGIILGNWLGGV